MPAHSPDAAASVSGIPPAPTARRVRRVATRSHGGIAKWPKGAAAPLLVEQTRGGVVESRHRGHVVQVDADGHIEHLLGDPEQLVTLRSAVKPFALLALIASGAADAFALTPPELALMAGSHSGEDLHVRTLMSVLRRAGVSQSALACGSEGMPLDQVTFLRLAADGERPGPIRHMCSASHSVFLLLSKYRGWPLERYWEPGHPSQVAATDAVARAFGARPDRVPIAIDNCGVPTYAFSLVDVARAFALLADPAAASDARADLAPALTRVRDAMLAAPEMVGGTQGRLDTALMKAVPGWLVVKAGAEGLRGVGILPGARGRLTPAAGLAVSIADGDAKNGRAGSAVMIEALRQVGVLDDRTLVKLEAFRRPRDIDPQGRPAAEAVPRFELAPVSELA